MDEFGELLFTASFGGMEIDIVNTSDSFSRALVRHEYPNVDGAILRDMGGEPRQTQCTLVFIPAAGSVIARVVEFLGIVNEGEPQRFIHPITGSYLAHAEDVQVQASGENRDYITISVTFVEHRSDITFVDLQEVNEDLAGVETAADNLDADLLAAGEDATTVGADSLTLATAWENTVGITARQINLELAEMANEIQDVMDTIDLESDVDNYPIMRSFTRLHNNLRNVAARIIRTSPKLTEYLVKTAQPLIAICQELYGGSDAIDQMETIVNLNDISNPGLIPSGKTLIVEVA